MAALIQHHAGADDRGTNEHAEHGQRGKNRRHYGSHTRKRAARTQPRVARDSTSLSRTPYAAWRFEHRTGFRSRPHGLRRAWLGWFLLARSGRERRDLPAISCGWCRRYLRETESGRGRRWCSEACRMKSYRAHRRVRHGAALRLVSDPAKAVTTPALHPEVPARAGPISAATTRGNLPRAAAIEFCGDFRNDLGRSTADAARMVGVALDVMLKHVVNCRGLGSMLDWTTPRRVASLWTHFDVKPTAGAEPALESRAAARVEPTLRPDRPGRPHARGNGGVDRRRDHRAPVRWRAARCRCCCPSGTSSSRTSRHPLNRTPGDNPASWTA